MALTSTLVNLLLSQDAQTSKVVDLMTICIFHERTFLTYMRYQSGNMKLSGHVFCQA